MSKPPTDYDANIAEHGCGCCLGCIAGPVVLLLGFFCFATVLDWIDPETDYGDGVGLFALLMIMSSGAGAFLGFLCAKPIVEFLKEIKWRIWDT